MQAAVFHGPKDIRVEDVPEPEVRAGTVKVAVDWCGICGTDLHEYLAGPIFVPPAGEPHPISGDTLPLTLGHEFAGTVAEVGDGVTGVSVGDAVTVEPVFRCGECPACRRERPNLCEKLGFYGLHGGGGGLSPRAVVPDYMVHRLPEGVPTEIGALVEPIAVGLHAVRRSGLQRGQSALVVGAGPIGAVTVQCLKALGAGTVIVSEPSETRKRKALELGADVVVDPTQEDLVARVGELTEGEGVEHSYDCAGIQASLEGALAATRKGGQVTIVSIWEGPISLDPNSLVMPEVGMTGTICYTPQDFADTIAMLADGTIDTEGIVTSRIELADVVGEGFDELVDHRDRHVKILVRSGG